MRAEQPLKVGDRVEILPVGDRPHGQAAAARRYAVVVALADEEGRVAVQVAGRQYPLHVPQGQLRRLAQHDHSDDSYR